MTLTKTIFRQNCIDKIKNAPKHNKIARDLRLNTILINELKKYKNKNILLYIPMSTEVNIYKTINYMRKHSNVFTPFMQNESFKLVPFRLPLKRKKFSILEAGNTLRNINKIDIAVVPIVGVDGKLQRIGFGKGMYDRFFAKLKKKPYTIFIQANICYTKEKICDDYDITCNKIIGNHNVKRNTNRWRNLYS